MNVGNKLFVQDLEVASKRVFVRVDFNVPIKDGTVENDKRLRASLPTIEYLRAQRARIILASHLGRPRGKRVPEMSLVPVAKALGALLGCEVRFVSDCVGPVAEAAVQALEDGQILLLENVRYHAEETSNDDAFARELAALCDVYVNDAFGSAHRAHASTEGITKHVGQAACGYLMKKELDYLGRALSDPKRPFLAIIGGAKISGKIEVIESLLPQVDALLLGGGMTYTFLKAQGLEVGNSLVEDESMGYARGLLDKAQHKLVLPEDHLVSDRCDFAERTLGQTRVVHQDAIPKDWLAIDIGPVAIERFRERIAEAQTILWNGPMGAFEIEAAATGTMAVARALAETTERGATTIIGGGDSASAVKKAGVADRVSHVSTGGGASLEFLEGKTLPGVAALSDR
ncbi:MAG: phosphoglycerate kinase [Proteobacteria bacterium]|nr:phosphoglycerate kinase [Pseudomonadota bacterium]